MARSSFVMCSYRHFDRHYTSTHNKMQIKNIPRDKPSKKKEASPHSAKNKRESSLAFSVGLRHGDFVCVCVSCFT